MIPTWFLYLAGFSMVVLGVLQLLHRPHKPGASVAERFVNLGTFWSLLLHHRRRRACSPWRSAIGRGRSGWPRRRHRRTRFRGIIRWCASRASSLSRSPRAASTPASATRPSTGNRAPATVAEPGSSGSPPTIVELSTPSCAYLDSPTVMGSLHVSDPDGDAQLIRAVAVHGRPARNEVDIALDDAGRNGNEWTGETHAQHHRRVGRNANGRHERRARQGDRPRRRAVGLLLQLGRASSSR